MGRILDRFLEERGYLMVIYPEKGKGYPSKHITSSKKIKIPFYENPGITESKASRLATYKLLGRNSDLYSYLGADSRSINLEITLTLPALAQFMKKTPWTDNAITLDNAPKFKFLKKTDPAPRDSGIITQDDLSEDATTLSRKSSSSNTDAGGNTYTQNGALRLKNSIENYDKQFRVLRNNGEALADLLGIPQEETLDAETPPDPEGIRAAYLYYINIFRSTVLGSEETGIGCPIVRLNFGPMYQDVPLLVSKYDVSMSKQAGFDVATLLPRQVVIKLSTFEIRVGDFTRHKPGKFEVDDNVATWESPLSYGTVDPRTEPRLTNVPIPRLGRFSGPGDSFNIPRRI